jgi:predicted Zn-dependent protease
LEKIPPRLRVHPDVLEIRWHIYAKAARWDASFDIATTLIKLAPKRNSGWIYRATTFRVMGKMKEAREVLLSAVDQLGDDPTVFYNLARLCCLLKRVEEARA